MISDKVCPTQSAFDRASEAYATHSALALDLNQSPEMRAAHKKEVKRAEGVILELFDTQDN